MGLKWTEDKINILKHIIDGHILGVIYFDFYGIVFTTFLQSPVGIQQLESTESMLQFPSEWKVIPGLENAYRKLWKDPPFSSWVYKSTIFNSKLLNYQRVIHSCSKAPTSKGGKWWWYTKASPSCVFFPKGIAVDPCWPHEPPPCLASNWWFHLLVSELPPIIRINKYIYIYI